MPLSGEATRPTEGNHDKNNTSSSKVSLCEEFVLPPLEKKKSLLRTFKRNTGLTNQRQTSYGLVTTTRNKGTSKGRLRRFVDNNCQQKGKNMYKYSYLRQKKTGRVKRVE
jgi:hypothetical protein